MRVFNFQSGDAAGAPETATNIEAREELIQPIGLAEPHGTETEEGGLRPFRVEEDDDVGSNNLPKIAGAVVVGLLIVGGGIYAYESSSRATNPPAQTVAMKTPAPAHMANAAPPPDTASQPMAPASTPAPVAPVRAARAETRVQETAANTPSSADASSSDTGINAPMNLTPETAPPAEAEQPAPGTAPAQTAMQQPVTAPNVSDTSNQPTPEVAAAAPTTPVESSATQPAEAAQTPAQTQPATVQPQVQPTVQPQVTAPAPAQ